MKVQTETKPGYLTTEFWLTIVVNVLVQANTIPVPEKWQGVAALLSVIGYAISRGLAKHGVPRVVATIPQPDPADVAAALPGLMAPPAAVSRARTVKPRVAP